MMSQTPDDETVDAEVIEEGSALALPQPIEPAVDYTETGVPTFDYVRNQIEGRFATSVGAAELAGDTPPATSLDEQFAAREQAGRDRLEEIRRSMRDHGSG